MPNKLITPEQAAKEIMKELKEQAKLAAKITGKDVDECEKYLFDKFSEHMFYVR